LQLDFALGTMQLDAEGLWVDPGKIGPDYGKYDPWLWQNSPGSIGEVQVDANGKELDRKIDDLPPPFLLPTPPSEDLPPASVGRETSSPRLRGDR